MVDTVVAVEECRYEESVDWREVDGGVERRLEVEESKRWRLWFDRSVTKEETGQKTADDLYLSKTQCNRALSRQSRIRDSSCSGGGMVGVTEKAVEGAKTSRNAHVLA